MQIPDGTTPVIFFIEGDKKDAADWLAVVSVVLMGIGSLLDGLGPHEAENLRRIRELWPSTDAFQIGIANGEEVVI